MSSLLVLSLHQAGVIRFSAEKCPKSFRCVVLDTLNTSYFAIPQKLEIKQLIVRSGVQSFAPKFFH